MKAFLNDTDWQLVWLAILIAGSIALGGLVIGVITMPADVTVMTVAEFQRAY